MTVLSASPAIGAAGDTGSSPVMPRPADAVPARRARVNVREVERAGDNLDGTGEGAGDMRASRTFPPILSGRPMPLRSESAHGREPAHSSSRLPGEQAFVAGCKKVGQARGQNQPARRFRDEAGLLQQLLLAAHLLARYAEVRRDRL